jgi:hypothetical protein
MVRLTQRGGAVRGGLAAAASALLASGPARSQEVETFEAPTTTADAAVLYYHENGRVQAIEPDVSLSHKFSDDTTVTAGFIADSLTGATPLGAVPSSLPQIYTRPYKVVPLGTPLTVTTASGGSTVVIVPPPSGATTQTLSESTTVPANTYPLDHGFYDTRVAGNLSIVQALTPNMKIDGGLAYSHEHDYRSESAHIGLSQDFFGHNTTLNAGVNYESNLSFPLGGTPSPLTAMNGEWKGPDASVHEIDAVAGVTQVMTRRWLTSVSYSYTSAHGYQTDPYKLVSVVDPVTAQPLQQLYESRPDSRRKQSAYWDNKIHLNTDIIGIALRGYRDDWGIKSITADVRYRYQFGDNFYLEPHLRYYRQNAADFFHYFLIGGEAVPQYASADTRLAAFHAQTYGFKFGLPLDAGSELNLRVEYYDQHGNGSPGAAFGQLRQQNLFPDLKAFTLLLGYSYAF